MIKTLRNKRKGKHKRAHSNELESLVSSPPSFPGIRLHVLTEEASEDEIEQISPVKHPVIIHKLDRKNSVITTFDELKQHRKLKSQKSSPSNWVIGKKVELKKENSEQNEIIIEEVEDEIEMIPIPSSGCVAVQGERTHMEDRFVEFGNLRTTFPEISTFGKNLSYFGVYDGHAGVRVADFCVEKLHKIIVNHIEEDNGKDENIGDSIEKGLVSADQEICELSAGTWKDGSCISILMLMDNILYTANLGDSHMVLCEIVQNKPRSILLTKAHKATEEEEKSRILSQGGMVMKGRVFGDLMISRALGDLDYKKPKQEENFISNIPYKTRHILKSKRHPFAILASDGLWDKISYQESVEIIQQERNSKNPYELSKILVDEAAKRGSMDNTTAMVVIFDWKPKDELNDDNKDEENGNNIIIIKENGSDSKNSEQIELDNT